MSLEVTDPVFWRLLHSHYIDAVEVQHPENVVAIVLLAEGLGFEAFVGAMVSGFVRARPAPGDDGSPCVAIELKLDDGWQRLVRVQAELLNIDPDDVQAEIDGELDDAIAAILREAE